MIDIDVHDHQLFITLDQDDPNYGTVFMLVKDLLGSQERDDNTWVVSYDDLKILRNKLDEVNLVDGRTVSNAASDWLNYLASLEDKNKWIKEGGMNEQVKALLEGKLKTTPYEDQYTAIAYLLENKRCGIFDDMGSGKSAVALSSSLIMPDVDKTLIICPYTVLMGFEKEIKKHTFLDYRSVPRGKEKALQYVKNVEETRGDWDILLVHPENLVQTKGKDSQNELCNLLSDMPWDLIIVDEFHLYKSLDAKRTQCVLSLLMSCRNSEGKYPRIVVMTGTPVSESPENAYVVLKVLNYGKVPHISKFNNHFIVKQKVNFGKNISFMKVTGYKNLDELRDRLEKVSIRRSKADMKGFPNRVLITRDVVLEGKQRALYAKFGKEAISKLGKADKVNLSSFFEGSQLSLTLRQVLNHPSLLGLDGDSAKYLELDSILEEILADREQKVVIWTEYRAAVDLLYERYNDLYGAVKIYGGVSNEELAKISKAFEFEESPRVAVCIPAKAGTGVDFLARARTAIYVERPYSLVLYKQSLDRIHRRVTEVNPTPLDIIRAKPATIMFLDAVGTIDEPIREKLYGKADLADAVVTSDEKLIEMGREDLLKYLR